MPSTERRLRRIDERLPDTGGGAIVPPGGGAPAGAPAVGVPGVPQSVRIINTFLLHGAGMGLAGANVAWAPPVGASPDYYVAQWDVTSAFTAPLTRRTEARGQTTIAFDAMPIWSAIFVRVAAVIGGVQGAWSATVTAVTPADTTVPDAPTALVASWSGLTGDLALSWSPSPSNNVRDYRVRIYASNGGALLREVYWPGQSYVWTRGQQFADTGGAFDPSVYVVVTARSWGAVFSTDLTGTATLSPPATPAGLTHSWAGDTGTAGPGCLVTWTQSAAVAGYRLTIDGVARDVGLTGRYEYGFAQNQAEHAGVADPVLSLSLVAVDALGQVSGAATATATNVAPPATTITVFPAFDRAGLTIGASAAQDLKDYRVRVYVASVLSDTFFTTDTKVLYQAANGNGSYQFDVAARDLFNQVGTASALTTAETLEDVGAFVASLRAGAIYSDQLTTNPETLFDAYTDDNRASGGVSYASNASWVRWIRFERPERDRYRTITLSMSPASGTTNWYIRTSEDGSTWSYFAGPVTSGRILTSVASAAAAQSAAVSAATLGGPTTSRVDLPSLVSARYVEVWLRNTGAATTVREFYPRRLVQSDDLEAEAIKAVHIGASAITAGAIQVGALDGFVITGATIQTAASGERVVIDSTGLKTYDSAGNIVAEATTATDGGIYLRRGVNAPLRLYSDSGLDLIGQLWGSGDSTFFGLKGGSSILVELTATDGAVESRLSMRPDGVDSETEFTHSVQINKGLRIGSTAGGLADVSVVPGDGGIAMTGGLNVGTVTGAGAGSARLSGGINVGTASGAPAGAVYVQGTQAGLTFWSRSDATAWTLYATTGAARLYSGSAGADVFTLTNTGGLTIAGTLTESSDRRLKHDIALIADSLAPLLALRPVTYTRDGERRSGLVAQDVAVVPELAHLVSECEGGMLGVNYTGLIPYIIRMLQQLDARLGALEGRR